MAPEVVAAPLCSRRPRLPSDEVHGKSDGHHQRVDLCISSPDPNAVSTDFDGIPKSAAEIAMSRSAAQNSMRSCESPASGTDVADAMSMPRQAHRGSTAVSAANLCGQPVSQIQNTLFKNLMLFRRREIMAQVTEPTVCTTAVQPDAPVSMHGNVRASLHTSSRLVPLPSGGSSSQMTPHSEEQRAPGTVAKRLPKMQVRPSMPNIADLVSLVPDIADVERHGRLPSLSPRDLAAESWNTPLQTSRSDVPRGCLSAQHGGGDLPKTLGQDVDAAAKLPSTALAEATAMCGPPLNLYLNNFEGGDLETVLETMASRSTTNERNKTSSALSGATMHAKPVDDRAGSASPTASAGQDDGGAAQPTPQLGGKDIGNAVQTLTMTAADVSRNMQS